jgi:hypothetical protein
MLRKILRTCLAALALTAAPPVPGQTVTPQNQPPEEPNLTAAMRREDPRLETKITFSSRHITIGELLEQIGRQAGVSLAAGERDGAQDVSVACFCKNVTLARILNALWSCVSYKGARWQWERSGQSGSYSYRLLQPSEARRLRERLQGWMQERFEADAMKLLAAVDGTDEQKKQAIQDIYGDPEIGLDVHPSEGLWLFVRMVKEGLTSEQLMGVMRQGTAIQVPLSSLSSQSRDYWLGKWREATAGARLYGDNGEERPLPEPQFVRFGKGRYYTTPTLGARFPSVASPGLFGGIPLEWLYRNHLHSLWMLDGDATDDPATARVMTRTPDAPTDPVRPEIPPPPPIDPTKPYVLPKLPEGPPPETANQQLERRMEQIAFGSQAPLIARLSEDEPRTWLAEPWNSTLRDYWKCLWNRPLMVKWREGVQLVSTEMWPADDPPIPLPFVRALRKDAKPGEFLPFDDLVKAAGMLTANQLVRLKGEFPVMKAVKDAQGIFTLFYRYPDLVKRALSDRGLEITPHVAEALRPLLPSFLMEVIDRGEARFLSVQIVTGGTREAPSREVIFRLRSQEGRAVRGPSGYGFKDVPQPQPKEKNGSP